MDTSERRRKSGPRVGREKMPRERERLTERSRGYAEWEGNQSSRRLKRCARAHDKDARVRAHVGGTNTRPRAIAH